MESLKKLKKDNVVRITELPVGRWTNDYKEILDGLARPERGKPSIIKNFTEHHTDRKVDFEVHFVKNSDAPIHDHEALRKLLRLEAISSIKMVLFDKNETIKEYSDPRDIIREFFEVRMAYYTKRKEARVQVLLAEVQKLASKSKFCELVCSGRVKLFRRTKAALVADLKQAGFDSGYDQLLQTSLDDMTQERIEQLNTAKAHKEEELERTRKATEAEVWEQELLALRGTLAATFAKEEEKPAEVEREGEGESPRESKTVKQKNKKQ